MTVPPWRRCSVRGCEQPATHERVVEQWRGQGGGTRTSPGVLVEITLCYCQPCHQQALRFQANRRRAA